MRKVLFFIAGTAPTADELAQIAAITGNVQIRTPSRGSPLYGVALEPADALAGTIPAAYKTASGGTAVDTTVFPGGDVTPNNVANIGALAVFPHNPGGIAAAGGTKQLIAVKAVVDPTTGVVTLTDVTTGVRLDFGHDRQGNRRRGNRPCYRREWRCGIVRYNGNV